MYNAQKIKFSIQNFFSKFDEIRSFLRSYLLAKPSMENFCLTNMYMYMKTMRN